MRKISRTIFTLILSTLMALTANGNPASLWDMIDVLQTKTFVDLTHAFDGEIPHGPGLEPASRETLFHYDEGVGTVGTGALLHKYSLPGQWGTHVDAPAHFIRGLRLLDEIPVKEMLLPLVILDLHEQVASDADYEISMQDVRRWESRYGPVPEGAFVAMRTDWSKRWPDTERFYNKDAEGVAHYPGWSLQVLKYLYEERGITASGHETPDTDRGEAASQGDYTLETYLLGQNHYQIEMLSNLDRVPEFGAMLIVSWPKPKAGSGFPARAFAILP